MANFCLAKLEAQLLHDNRDEVCAPALYLRYVDDIFCVFRDGCMHESFLAKLNSLHPNLKFTSELGPYQHFLFWTLKSCSPQQKMEVSLPMYLENLHTLV